MNYRNIFCASGFNKATLATEVTLLRQSVIFPGRCFNGAKYVILLRFMTKILISFLFLVSPAFAAPFECKSEIDAIVADNDIQDRGQIVIKGEMAANLELRYVSLKIRDIKDREAYSWVLKPRESDTVNYHFFDLQDYYYQLQFPKNVGQSPFKSKVSISLESHISTVTLECLIGQ